MRNLWVLALLAGFAVGYFVRTRPSDRFTAIPNSPLALDQKTGQVCTTYPDGKDAPPCIDLYRKY